VKLYDDPSSGNGYKVRLLLAQLGTSYEYVQVDILAGETRTESFLKKNPAGKVPVLELDDGETLPESNAILYWLSQNTPYWPRDGRDQARVMRWLFFEQRSHMPYIGGARYWLAIQKAELTRSQRLMVEELQAGGLKALGILDGHLRENDFLVSDSYSIADIALYAYTHVADEGGFELAPFDGIRDWITRVQLQPGYVGIDEWPRR